jgi:hypothetical protein
MTFPVGIFAALGKAGYKMYAYFFKGPKIDAALKYQAYEKEYISVSPFNNTTDNISSNKILHRYRFTGNYILMLKNNSRNTAYRISLSNASTIFSSFDHIHQLEHLEPGQKLELKITFTHIADLTDAESDKVPSIPWESHNKYLIIVYQNEAGNNFFTRFKISDRDSINTYNIGLPIQ